MCNLSEGVWEKGKFEQLVDIVKIMLSEGKKFDEIVLPFDIAPEKAKMIKEKIGNLL